MKIGKLKSIQMLKASGAMANLSGLSDLLQLGEQHLYSTNSDDWGEFANQVRAHGPDAAHQLWEFLDRLPELAKAGGHFRFATGLDDPLMAPAGSVAHDAAVKWSNILSTAIDLAGYDFHPQSVEDAKATFDRMSGLLGSADDLIASRLRFFERESAEG